MFDLTLQFPSNIIICGPSGSGKSTNIIYNILKYKSILYNRLNLHVVYFYSEYQAFFDKLREEKLVDVFSSDDPTAENVLKYSAQHRSTGTVCIIDDMLHNLSDGVSQLFTKVGHHSNIAIVFTSQSLFHQSREYRTMALNAHYLFLMKAPRSGHQIVDLAKQMSPYNVKYVIEAFLHATSKPFSYLFMDFSQRQNDCLRLRTDIFPQEQPMRVFIATHT